MSKARVTLALWLVSAAAALAVILTMARPAAAAGLQDAATPPPPDCASCHPDQVKQWESGNHAQAFSRDTFQTAWKTGKNPQYCLACHTTGYDAATGNYTQASVSCTACHQASPNGHPGGQMSISDSAVFCGTCHTTTFHEWQKSGHGQVNLPCTSCHDMHSTELRFKNASDLCSNCHTQAGSAGMPMSTEATCTDCHMSTESGTSRVEGQAPTGHTFVLDSTACERCHKSDIHAAHQITMTSSLQPGTDKLITTPAAASVAPSTSRPGGLTGIAGGAFGGLILGALMATALRRRH